MMHCPSLGRSTRLLNSMPAVGHVPANKCASCNPSLAAPTASTTRCATRSWYSGSAGSPAGAIVVTPAQAAAVDAGLAWLAAQQNENGSWTAKIGYKLNEDYRYTAQRGHVGVAALAGMAFLAGGHAAVRKVGEAQE